MQLVQLNVAARLQSYINHRVDAIFGDPLFGMSYFGRADHTGICTWKRGLKWQVSVTPIMVT